MNKITMKMIITIIIIFASHLFGSSNTNINMFTEHYPPRNMEVNGKLTGAYVDILGIMLKKMNSTQSIKDVTLTNWARAYSLAKMKKNTMVFSASRTKSRESLFKWVGPVTSGKIGLIALKSKNIKINKISDINKYKIGVVHKDIGESLLLDNNVNKKNISHIKGKKAVILSLKKMEQNRIDIFSYNTTVAFYTAGTNNFDVNKFEVIYVLKETDSYFAFNKDTDDKIINKWQKSLDEMKKDGSFNKVLKKYNINL